MKTLAKIVFGTLGCVLVISAVGVMVPRAVYAVVATIIRDQDQPARHPFTTNCSALETASDLTECDTPAIPAGQEFVIETISINGGGSSINDVLGVIISTTSGGTNFQTDLNPIFDSGLGLALNVADYRNAQPLRLYADPGKTIHCLIETTHANPSPSFGLSGNCNFSGYLVSLP